MSELTGKTQNRKQDCEIVYVEEKAPEPWIQRESFYNKDLPLPEEDDERVYDAKHIGSFMVPSPLMRLKTPSSMSSFNNDRGEDGRISPVPSLDVSIKSERRDSHSSVARSKSSQSSVESLPQFYGLFEDSNICIKDTVSLDKFNQIIESSPLGLNNEYFSKNTSDEENDYLNLGAVRAADEKLGLASIMESEVLTAKHTISSEGVKNVTLQTNDPTKSLHSKSTVQKTETEKLSNNAVKEGTGDLLKQSTNKETRQIDQINLSNTSDNDLKSSSIDVGNLAEGSLNVGVLETCIGVSGSHAVTPLAAGAAGVLFSELTDHENSPAYSKIENLEIEQKIEFVSKEYNKSNGLGSAAVDSGIESLDRTQRKDFISNEYNAFNNLGYSSADKETFPTENSDLDEVSEPGILPFKYAAISSSIGVKSSEEHDIIDFKLRAQDETSISGRTTNVFDEDVFTLQSIQDSNKLSDHLTSDDDAPSSNLNVSLEVPLEISDDQNVQNLVNPAVDIRLRKDVIYLNDNISASLEEANMKQSKSDNSKILNETTIQTNAPETDVRSGKGNEVRSIDSKANLIDNQLLSNLGVGIALGVIPSVIGSSAEIVLGSEISATTGSEIFGLNESGVNIYIHRPESKTNMMNVLNEPVIDADTVHFTRDNLDDSKQSDKISASPITGYYGDKFISTKIEDAQVHLLNAKNEKDIHDIQIAPMHQGSEDIQLESEYAGNKLFPVHLRISADKICSAIFKNEGSEQANPSISSTEYESDTGELFISKLGNDFMGSIIQNSPIKNDIYPNSDGNIESEHFSKQLNQKELNSTLFAYDSWLNSEMNEIAVHLATNDIKSDDYAKEWFESIFSGPDFCTTLSEKASSIYADYGPVGLVEIALDLMKLNSDELLELDSRNEILTKLTSDMNPNEAYLAKLDLIVPELLYSLQDNYANEFERNNESDYDSKFTLLVAKCRNAEELLKQLSKIIKEMNDDIRVLTRENNNKSSRIKILEDALQKK